MWCASSGFSPVPIRNVSEMFFSFTVSSLMSRCPRSISSSAVSLLPTPLSPVISTPMPYTSTSTPWIVIVAAKTSSSCEYRRREKSEDSSGVERIAVAFFSASSTKCSEGLYPPMNTIQGGSYEKILSIFSYSFFFSSISIYDCSALPMSWMLEPEKSSK